MSNIIARSNIYPCIGNPLRDQKFINEIEDYNYLQKIYKTQRIEATGMQFTEKQLQLLEIEMRCVYAKKDPCWGYINGEGIRCRCIEARCPQIYSCNPTFSVEQKDSWTMDIISKNLYGHPENQKKYYLVDLVSDEEMLRYMSDPKGDGFEHSILAEPNENDDIKSCGGRRLVVVGYQDTYFGDADNQLSPIWGYVDDTEENGPVIKNKYGKTKEVITSNTEEHIEDESIKSTEKAEPIIEINLEESQNNITIDAAKLEEYKKIINTKLEDSYEITELNKDLIMKISNNRRMNFLLCNEAELSYVSSMLLQAGIEHSIESRFSEETVNLWTIDSADIELKGIPLLISNIFFDQDCNLDREDVWSEILNSNCVNQLVTKGREFFCFAGKDNIKRWGCRNLYGATHLVLKAQDLIVKKNNYMLQEITLVRDKKSYIVLDTSNAEKLGISSSELWDALECLKDSEEIMEFPSVISGIYLSMSDQEFVIKGIGHMRFDEY